MRASFSAVLRIYGRQVSLWSFDETGEEVELQKGLAFLQPLPLEKNGEQFLQTELGIRREERFLYLGDGACPLDQVSLICCDGICYDIHGAQPVYLGNEVNHWRAVLSVREEAAER